MARLDLGGLHDLWYRIDDIFCRLSEAIGSISFSGTTLSWRHANGSSAGSADLGATFAKRNQAGSSLRLNGKKLSLVSCDGTILSTVTLP